MSGIDFDAIAKKYSSSGLSQFSQDNEEKKNKEIGHVDFSEIASRRKSQGQSVTSSWDQPLERNIVGETAAALGRGVGTAVEMTGRGIQQIGAESAGEKLREAGEAVQRAEFLAPSAELEAGEAGIVRRTLAGAAESIPMSAVPLATGVAGAAAGAATTVNPIGAAIGGLVGGAAGLGTVFYGGTYSAEKERALKEFETLHPDWTQEQREQEASSFAHKQALWETGTEGVSDLVMAGIGKAVAKGIAKEGVTGAKAVLRDLIGSGGPKEMAKKFAETYASEGGSEIVSYLGQAANEQSYGLGEGPTLTGALDTAMTSLWMTGIFGAAGAGMNYKEREKTVSGLNSENKLIRDRAARKVEERVAKELGPEQAVQWRNTFNSSIERGEGGNFSIDSPLFGAATEAYEKEGDSVLGRALGSVVDTETAISEPQEDLRPLYDQLQSDVESLASQRETTGTPISDEEQKALDRASIMLATEQEERTSSDKKTQLPDDLQNIDSMSRKKLIEVAKKYNIPTGKSNLGKQIKESVKRFADNYKKQEGYAKEELEAGQAAQAEEETGARTGERKLQQIGSLAGVVDFKNTSIDELQGIVKKVQETPFEQLTAQERKVADAIGVTQAQKGGQGGQGQPGVVGQGIARSQEAEIVTGQVKGDMATFSEQSGTLGIPREEMPQITSEQRGALANNLRSKGIEYNRTEKAPRDLKPSQDEFSPEKVQQAREYNGPERAILVSQDGHVIDGHHQWMQKLEDAPNDPIPVIELGGNAQDVIKAVREFPGATTAGESKGPVKQQSSKVKEEKQPVDASEGKKKAEGSRKELLEPITEKEGTEQLGTEKRTRYLGEQETEAAPTESKRRTIYEAKKFQEARRDPKKHTQITEQRDYKDKLPKSTERLMNITADRYRAFNDAQASVDENKEHLVKLFDKAGTDSITVTVDGNNFTVKKPLPGKEQVIMNLAGRDALDALKQKYKDAGLLTFDYDQGVTLMVQPAVAGKSNAAAYGPKTLESAAKEHVKFMRELAEARFARDAARKRIKETILPNLRDNGIDHVWTNSAKDTTFWIERSPAIKKFSTEEAKEAYQQEREETQARPEFEKKRTQRLKTAGVSEGKAQGLKRGEKADRQAAAEAELDQILKSISGTPLPKGQRADIMGELTKQYGRGVLAQQERGVFEVVSTERAAEAIRGDRNNIELKRSAGNQRLEGLTFPDGRVWLVDGNIEAGTASGVLAHELGVHARKLGFKDEKSFQAILKRVEALVKTDEKLKAARARVPENTPSQNVNEETLAYLVSDAPQHGLVKRLMSAVKRFLAQRGWFRMTLDKLTPSDLQALAQSAVRADMPTVTRATAGVNEFAQSVKMSTAKAADKIKGLANFKKWFGDSKIVDENGEPKVVYHGTAAPFITSFSHEMATDKLGRKMGLGLGKGKFYLTEYEMSAKMAAEAAAARGDGNTPQAMPLYVKIEKPMTMDEYDRRFKEISGGRGVSSSQYEGGYTMKKRDALIKKLDTAIRKEGFDGIIDDVSGQIAVFKPTQIKSIHNTGEWLPTGPEIMRSYAGERAKTANVKTLAEAKSMQKAGQDNESIRQATGWFQGTDKKWRFEIDDSKSNVIATTRGGLSQKLNTILNHPDIFIAYPELKDIYVSKSSIKGGSSYDSNTNMIMIGSWDVAPDLFKIEEDRIYEEIDSFSDEEFTEEIENEYEKKLNDLYKKRNEFNDKQKQYLYDKDVLLHEIQHVIQDFERFARGGSPREFPDVSDLIKGNRDNLNLYLRDIGINKFRSSGKEKLKSGEWTVSDYRDAIDDFISKSEYAEEIISIQKEISRLVKENPRDLYNRLAGEIESRDVESRSKMTTEERKATKPYESQGIPEKDMIVRFGDGIMASMYATAQEARRNTENLNATKDGQTSTTSVEAGEKAIQSIMQTLHKVTQKTEAELEKSKDKEKKFLDQYRKLSSGLDAIPIDESVSLLNGLVRQADIPDGSKKRIGQLIKSITDAKRPETQRQRLNIALDKLRSDISSRFRSQIRAQVKRAAGPKQEGVIKRGRYWHEQEKDITSIREIVHNMSPEQATQSISKVENRLDGLKERLKGAAQENAEAIRNQIADAELRLHHLRTFGGLKDKSIDQLLDAKYQIEELRRLGRSRLRSAKEAWQQEIDRKTNWLAQEITGQDDPRPETVAQKNRRKQKEKSLIGKAKGAYQAVENSIQSWEHLLDRITIKSGKKIFQSRAVKELGSMAHAATRGAEKYNRETTDKMLAKGLEIFGVKKGGALTKRLQKLAKKTGNIKVAGDTLQLSPMEAAYFYNVRKETGSDKLFKKMGFTSETWSGIDSLMTKELKAWADYLHDDLLVDAIQGETEAYRAVNGVDRAPVGLFRDDQTDIPVMNLNSAVMNRIFDANHYRAWAVPSKTFNDLFSVPETRGYIEQYAGTSTLKALDKFLDDFAKTPRELRGDMAWMDKLRSNVVMSMIGANPTTFFKQLTSIPAYAADIPTHAFVKNFAHGLGNFWAVRRMIKDSQMAQERFGSGYDRDIHEASKQTAEQVIGGKVTRMRDMLMAMTKLGDQAAVYAGYTVYKYHYDKNKSKGHAEAHRIGIEEFERATERTQQAAGIKDRGSFERGSSLQKLLTMYMTSPAAYTRQTMAALRHFKTDPVGSSKRLLLFNVMLPMAFQAVASGFVGTSGEDDEQWEEFWAKELRAVALGPFLGLPIARDIAAGLWDSAMGEWYGSDVQHSPVTETTKSLTQAVFHASKGLREFDDEAIEKAKGELLDFLGYAAGWPIKPGRRMQEGIEDFLSGDTEHHLLSLSGYSRAARDERYLGE